MASCDPNAILERARCLDCVPNGILASIRTWLLCQLANVPTTLCGDPMIDAQALLYLNNYLVRVAANGGGAVSQNNQDAIHIFLCTLIQNAIDTQAISMLCVTPDNFIAAATPVLRTAGNDPWTYANNVGVAVGAGNENLWFTLGVGGLANTGPSGFGVIQSGVIPSTLPTQNNSLVAQVPVINTAFNEYTMGARDSHSNVHEFSIIHKFGANRRFACYSGGADLFEAVGGLPDQANCFLCGSRRAANDWGFYQGLGGAFRTIATAVTNPGAIPTVDVWAFCLNDTGGVSGQGRLTISFVGVFGALTATQIQALYNAVNVMRTSMGGGTI